MKEAKLKSSLPQAAKNKMVNNYFSMSLVNLVFMATHRVHTSVSKTFYRNIFQEKVHF